MFILFNHLVCQIKEQLCVVFFYERFSSFFRFSGNWALHKDISQFGFISSFSYLYMRSCIAHAVLEVSNVKWLTLNHILHINKS